MTITKEYCDRCGKEVDAEDPLNHRIFPLIWRSPKCQIRFRNDVRFTETTKMICEECLKELLIWWNSKKSQTTM